LADGAVVAALVDGAVVAALVDGAVGATLKWLKLIGTQQTGPFWSPG
jgi:hypothetical protein